MLKILIFLINFETAKLFLHKINILKVLPDILN